MGNVVLLSGGMDSSACAVLAHRSDPLARALLVDYGQPHRDQELGRAQALAMRLGMTWDVVPVSSAFGALRPRDMAASPTVTGRNAVLLALAAAHGAAWFSAGTITVWIGACADDAAAFPDCRRPFLDAIGEAMSLALGRTVRIVAPFLDVSKRQMVANADGPTLEAMRRSWSCYRGGITPCADCTPCCLRYDAFLATGVPDLINPLYLTGGDPHRERE
jgi:7-cyano-7-deazaguanine synthase